MSCETCGAELAGLTVIDDVDGRETFLAPRSVPVDPEEQERTESDQTTAARAKAPSLSDLSTDRAPALPAKDAEPSSPTLLPFAEATDEVIAPFTSIVHRKRALVLPAPAAGASSSEPPTRFMRGLEQHIELPGGSIVDDFEIETKVGAGAMGVVYSARHTRLGRRAAIKVIAPAMGADPQALARFEREAKTLASLHHPNIVDVYSFGTLADGRSYFVMEYLVGEALDERLQRGRLSLEEALDIIDQMARGLEAAHAQGIVHRDLKPSNTFLARIGREQRHAVKLLDFGLVKTSAADDVEKTASDAVIGTALYLSPEQARSPSVDARSDIYALGCVAYELVLGRHPFPDARTPTAAIAAHLTEPPPQPKTIWPAVPAALDLLLFSMLAKDPRYRPTLAQVRSVIAGLPVPTAPGREMRAATEPVQNRQRRSPLWMAGFFAFAVLVGVVIGAKFRGGTSTNTKAEQKAQGNGTSSAVSGEPAATPAAALPVIGGTLSVDSKPATDVLIDGERRGRTPIVILQVSPGRHEVTLLNASYSISETFQVEINPGKTETVVKDYSKVKTAR